MSSLWLSALIADHTPWHEIHALPFLLTVLNRLKNIAVLLICVPTTSTMNIAAAVP